MSIIIDLYGVGMYSNKINYSVYTSFTKMSMLGSKPGSFYFYIQELYG